MWEVPSFLAVGWAPKKSRTWFEIFPNHTKKSLLLFGWGLLWSFFIAAFLAHTHGLCSDGDALCAPNDVRREKFASLRAVRESERACWRWKSAFRGKSWISHWVQALHPQLFPPQINLARFRDCFDKMRKSPSCSAIVSVTRRKIGKRSFVVKSLTRLTSSSRNSPRPWRNSTFRKQKHYSTFGASNELISLLCVFDSVHQINFNTCALTG